MDAGKYNQKIQFWHDLIVVSDSGAPVLSGASKDLETWCNYYEPEANGSGRANEAGEFSLSTFCRFRIRRRAGFTLSVKHYIVFRNARYTIHQIGDSNNPANSTSDITFYASFKHNLEIVMPSVIWDGEACWNDGLTWGQTFPICAQAGIWNDNSFWNDTSFWGNTGT